MHDYRLEDARQLWFKQNQTITIHDYLHYIEQRLAERILPVLAKKYLADHKLQTTMYLRRAFMRYTNAREGALLAQLVMKRHSIGIIQSHLPRQVYNNTASTNRILTMMYLRRAFIQNTGTKWTQFAGIVMSYLPRDHDYNKIDIHRRLIQQSIDTIEGSSSIQAALSIVLVKESIGFTPKDVCELYRTYEGIHDPRLFVPKRIMHDTFWTSHKRI